MTTGLREAVAEVLFENPATQALALEAVAAYEATGPDDPKARARWHAAALACCRGRPRKSTAPDTERRRMAEALDESPDDAARRHAAEFAAEQAAGDAG